MFKNILLVLLCCALSLILSCSSTDNYSEPINETSSDEKDLDLGEIQVYATRMDQLKTGSKLLDFGDLLKIDKIFAYIQQNRQGTQKDIKAVQRMVEFLVSANGRMIDFNKTIQSEQVQKIKNSLGADGTKSSTNEEEITNNTSENSVVTKKTPDSVPSDENDFQNNLIDTFKSGLSSQNENNNTPYYVQLLESGSTHLLGKSLEFFYNLENIPSDYKLYSIPVVVTFTPGRITRQNYVGETTITFDQATKNKFRIVAVGPKNLSNFITTTVAELRTFGIKAAISAKAEQIAADAKYKQLIEDLDEFSRIARQTSFQIIIKDSNQIQVRYYGDMEFKKNLFLSPIELPLQLFVICSKDAFKDSSNESKNNSPEYNYVKYSFTQNDLKLTSPFTKNTIEKKLTYSYIWKYFPYYPFKSCFGKSNYDKSKYENKPNNSNKEKELPVFLIPETPDVTMISHGHHLEIFGKSLREVKAKDKLSFVLKDKYQTTSLPIRLATNENRALIKIDIKDYFCSGKELVLAFKVTRKEQDTNKTILQSELKCTVPEILKVNKLTVQETGSPNLIISGEGFSFPESKLTINGYWEKKEGNTKVTKDLFQGKTFKILNDGTILFENFSKEERNIVLKESLSLHLSLTNKEDQKKIFDTYVYYHSPTPKKSTPPESVCQILSSNNAIINQNGIQFQTEIKFSSDFLKKVTAEGSNITLKYFVNGAEIGTSKAESLPKISSVKYDLKKLNYKFSFKTIETIDISKITKKGVVLEVFSEENGQATLLATKMFYAYVVPPETQTNAAKE